MIRINLLAVRELEEAAARRRELKLAGAGLAVVLIAIPLVFFSQADRLESAEARVQQLEKVIADIREQNKEIEKLEKQKQELEDKVRVVQSLTSPGRRAAPVQILDDLSTYTPDFLWLVDFSEKNGKTRLTGRAVDNQTIAAFARDLSNSLYFKTIEIRETVQEPPASRRSRRRGSNTLPIPVTRFLIEANIDYLSKVNTGDSRDGDGEGPQKNGQAPAQEEQ